MIVEIVTRVSLNILLLNYLSLKILFLIVLLFLQFCAADGDETVVHSSTEHGNCLIFEDIRNSTKESPLTWYVFPSWILYIVAHFRNFQSKNSAICFIFSDRLLGIRRSILLASSFCLVA